MIKLPVINETCFSAHYKHNANCQRTSCSNWIKNSENNNCALIIMLKNGGRQLTLNEVGKYFNLSRMRICQIIKEIHKKIIKNTSNLL